jgi:hypothetical protein
MVVLGFSLTQVPCQTGAHRRQVFRGASTYDPFRQCSKFDYLKKPGFEHDRGGFLAGRITFLPLFTGWRFLPVFPNARL